MILSYFLKFFWDLANRKGLTRTKEKEIKHIYVVIVRLPETNFHTIHDNLL